MPRTLVAAVAVLLAWTGGAAAQSFELAERIDKSNFFDKFDFLTKGRGAHPYDDNNSYVNYQDVGRARAKDIARIQDGEVYLGVDHTTVLNHTGHPGRDTFRIESKKTYRHGLFVARFSHMPAVACGAWPAFWTLGTGAWPAAGEMDLYTGWNLNTHNKPTLHAGPERDVGRCTLAGAEQGGHVLAEDCDSHAASHAPGQGCQTEEKTDGIWGSPDGGTQALVWTSDDIKIYTWPRGKEPANLGNDEIDTDAWAATKPSLHLKTCDIDRAFQHQRLMLDIAFCGTPAGSVFWDHPDHLGEPTCAETTGVSRCEDYVRRNPAAFKDVYFQIRDIRHFRLKRETRTSSTRSAATSSRHRPIKSPLGKSSLGKTSSSAPRPAGTPSAVLSAGDGISSGNTSTTASRPVPTKYHHHPLGRSSSSAPRPARTPSAVLSAGHGIPAGNTSTTSPSRDRPTTPPLGKSSSSASAPARTPSVVLDTALSGNTTSRHGPTKSPLGKSPSSAARPVVTASAAPNATDIAPSGNHSTSSTTKSPDGSTYVIPPRRSGTTQLRSASRGPGSAPTPKASAGRPGPGSTAAATGAGGPGSHARSSSASASRGAAVTPSTLTRVPKVSGGSSRSASAEDAKTERPSGIADPGADGKATTSSSGPAAAPAPSSSPSLAPGSGPTTTRPGLAPASVVPGAGSSSLSEARAALTSTVLISRSGARFVYLNKTSSSYLEPSVYSTVVVVEAALTKDAAAGAAEASKAPSSGAAGQASAGDGSPAGLASAAAAKSLSLYPVASAGVGLRFGGGEAAGPEPTPSGSRGAAQVGPPAADAASVVADGAPVITGMASVVAGAAASVITDAASVLTATAGVDAGGAGPGAGEMSAVTVYRTVRSTVTACPPAVTSCAVGGVTVVEVPWYVTYCPVTPVETQALETSTASPGAPARVRVVVVNIFRIRRCPSAVPDCPLGSVGTVSATKTLCDGKECTPPGPTEPPRPGAGPWKTSGTGSNDRGPEKQMGDGVLPPAAPSDSAPSRATRTVTITRCPPTASGCFVGQTTTTVVDCPGPECGRPTGPARDPVSGTHSPGPDASPGLDPKTPLLSHSNQEKGPERPDARPGPGEDRQEKGPEHPQAWPGPVKTHQETGAGHPDVKPEPAKTHQQQSTAAPDSPRPRETRILTVTRCPPSAPGCSVGSLTTVVVEASCSGAACSVATAAAQPPPGPPHKHPTGGESRSDAESGRPRCPDGTKDKVPSPAGTKDKVPSPAGTKDKVPSPAGTKDKDKDKDKVPLKHLKDSGGGAVAPGNDEGRETRPDGTPLNMHATAEASVRLELGGGVPLEKPEKGPREGLEADGSPVRKPKDGPKQDVKTESPTQNPKQNPAKGPNQDPQTAEDPTKSPTEISKIRPDAGPPPQEGPGTKTLPSGVASPTEKSKGGPSADSEPSAVPGRETPAKDDSLAGPAGGGTSGDGAPESGAPGIARGSQSSPSPGVPRPTGSGVALLHSGAARARAGPGPWSLLLGAAVLLL